MGNPCKEGLNVVYLPIKSLTFFWTANGGEYDVVKYLEWKG